MTHEFAENSYEKMQYRRCGRSGLKLPAISLGAWETFGGYVDTKTSRKCRTFFKSIELFLHG